MCAWFLNTPPACVIGKFFRQLKKQLYFRKYLRKQALSANLRISQVYFCNVQSNFLESSVKLGRKELYFLAVYQNLRNIKTLTNKISSRHFQEDLRKVLIFDGETRLFAKFAFAFYFLFTTK